MLSKPVLVRYRVAPMHRDLVAVFEIAITERPDDAKMPVEDEDLVARRDIDFIVEKSDPAQASVPAAPRPVDVYRIPVERLDNGLTRRVDNENAAVTLALFAAAHD